MTDIVERLRVYATDDHERGCDGRCYACACGYDDKRDPLLKEAANEIERLRAALERIAAMRDYQLPKPQDIARAALAAQPAPGKEGGHERHPVRCGVADTDDRRNRLLAVGVDY